METVWKCRTPGAEHGGQTLFPVIARRVVSDSEKHRIHVPNILLVVIWGP